MNEAYIRNLTDNELATLLRSYFDMDRRDKTTLTESQELAIAEAVSRFVLEHS